jgi:hypothetical protein
MTIRYQHTQRGILTIAALLAAAVVAASVASIEPSPTRWLGLALMVGFAILAGLFSSLTVVVDDDELRWYFGPGAWSLELSPRARRDRIGPRRAQQLAERFRHSHAARFPAL